MKKFISLFSLFLIATSLFSQNKIAMIYNESTTVANSYKELITPYGLTVDLVEINEVKTFDFSTYDLIIATETSSNGNVSWGGDDEVNTIKNTNLPILGMGQGGSVLFGKMNKWANWGQSASQSFVNISVEESSHDIFTYPNSLDVSSGTLKVSEGGLGAVTPYIGAGVPQNVKVLSKLGENQNYGSLVYEDSKYFLWTGWSNEGAAKLNENGKKLFVNVVFEVGGFTYTTLNTMHDKRNGNLTVYPNPTEGLINISGIEKITKIEVLNSTGSIIFNPESVERQIDLSHLESGIYTLRIHSEGNIFNKLVKR